MHIDKIKINNFKNYKTAQINFSKKINFLFGENGAGKTNLLDSIYYLSYGKSAVNSFDFDSINHKESFFSISGLFGFALPHWRFVVNAKVSSKSTIILLWYIKKIPPMY